MTSVSNRKIAEHKRKLDPRLWFALSLTQDRLVELKKRELKKLNKLAAAFTKQRSKEDREIPAEPALALFNPLLHGLVIPDLEKSLVGPKFKQPYIAAFIKFYGNRQDLESMDVAVRSRAGDIFTVYLPLDRVENLAAMPAVARIELPKPLFPNLNVAIPTHEIDDRHNAMPPETGTGVTVGIYDSILDLYHPNFRNADGGGTDNLGTTRVRFLWDQNLNPLPMENTPQGNDPSLTWNYGVEYTQAAIDGELNKPAASAAYAAVRHGGAVGSHGSNVAGCAVGNGRAAGNGGEPAGTFVGAAPAADIIFVGWRSGHHVDPVGVIPYTDTAFLADGLAYIFARADDLGQPCVVNVSESDDQGPHDGSSLSQEFIDNLLDQPGRAICVASGNSNERDSHAEGNVAAGATENLILAYTAGADNDDVISLWYDGHDRISVRVTEPGGAVHGPVAPGGSLSEAITNGEQISINSILDDPNNGDNSIQIIITASAANTIPAGNWTIALTGDTIINGRFQAWVDRNNLNESDFQAPHLTADTHTLGDLSTTRRPITVGALDKPVGAAAELPSSFSGAGPTRDGRIKPEIAAVGRSVMTVRSRNMNAAAPGNFYVSASGTSFASPLVAGTAALLFQCRGAGLAWSDIKQILLDNADSSGLVIPHNAAGFGRLRASAICAAGDTDVDVWLRNVPGDLGEEPFAGTFFWESPDIEVLDASMNPAANPTHGVDNFIRVTARNRGSQKAHNTEVYLYWGDPATNMPYPDAWQSLGLYTDPDGDGVFQQQANKYVIPLLDAGTAQSVVYKWNPPAPGTNTRGDNHFCLLARVENEADRADLLPGLIWWPLVKVENNISVRNVHVQEVADDGDAVFTFTALGTTGKDRLVILTDLIGAEITITLPAQAVPYRDMKSVNLIGHPLPPYPWGPCCKTPDHFRKRRHKGADLQRLTDIHGAADITMDGETARIRARGTKEIRLDELKLAPNAHLPINLRIRNVTFKKKEPRLRVTQYSDGRVAGGVTLVLKKA